MADRIIRIERHRYDKDHWIRPSPRNTNTEQKYRVFYEGEEIGVWRVPSCAAARWLLEHGKAERSDTLRMFRGDQPSMRGNMGWFADRTVIEDDNGSIRWAKYRPFPRDGALAGRLFQGGDE